MEFRHLVSFLAIADEVHFGRAARRLNLTQPSLSQHLARLEREVGVQLVARNSREVRLTPAGHAFRGEAKKILELKRRTLEITRDTAAGRAGKINIGFNLPAGHRILPPTLAHMHTSHPGVVPRLWERRTGPQIKSLLSGELDVGFIFGLPPTSSLHSKEVLRVRILAVVGEHHEWAARAQVPFGDLERQPCLLFHRTQCPALYDTISRAADRAGIKLRVVAEVDDPGASALLVTTRPVVGFASQERALGIAGARAVPLVDPVPTIPVHVVWRPPRTRLVETLLDSLEHAEADLEREQQTTEAKSDQSATARRSNFSMMAP
ncbi:LysR family transcriptional regulator [Frankia sp. CcI49]|uniref:LysR family transcriptional regulator n=1 Tax=unclassified Frankia TaxID=2632575 RepID=UPI0006CA4B4F|nr:MULTISPECIES: LysR family transcriptional regulator [unclassified Frankia]KPM53944.1 LysR family transcriptional regulator [Frankia sp. R43]ONH61895.1 LysR family transcriptional regulator [Frankia sp. CcI49]